MADNKQLQLKSAYGKIKRAEREAITTWTNVLYPDKDAVALEREWEHRKTRAFAKYCYKNISKTAPSGRLWKDVFKDVTGQDLIKYATDLASKKL
ncbi:MAG: hypothetical protein VW683_09545 [Betaproteobacteria bacterium]